MLDNCAPTIPSGAPCPGDIGLWARALCASLPQGFVWEAAEQSGTLMNGRVMVPAHLLDLLHAEACALLSEWHCDTATRTLDSWHADYGIPDDCGVNDLCTKVTLIGDGRCETLNEIGKSLGYDLCCSVPPVEMMCGECWEMGIDQMAPQPEWLDGGCELGFLGLGVCPPATGIGSNLGQAVLNVSGEVCYISGYHEGDGTSATVLPCTIEGECSLWQPPQTGEFTLCGAPWRLDYNGTADTLIVGIAGTSPALIEPAYTMMGCMEMGCDQLCAPPVEEMFCFVEKHAHAHLTVIRQYC